MTKYEKQRINGQRIKPSPIEVWTYQLSPEEIPGHILDYASKEMLRRLRSPSLKKEIPVSVLSKLIVEFTKLVRDDPSTTTRIGAVNILQILDQPGLPKERRVELLLKGIREAVSQEDKDILEGKIREITETKELEMSEKDG